MKRSTVSSTFDEHLLFFKRLVRNPRKVGAIAPSSRRLASQMLEGLKLTPGARIAELGPGTGSVTADIARRLPPDGACLALDQDPAFIAQLRRRFGRILCVCGGAEHLVDLGRAHGLLPFDHIVSGLPFASLPPSTTRLIVNAIDTSLRVGGSFTTFQYVHAMQFPGSAMFRKAMTERLGIEPSWKLVLANVPPAVVLRWRRVR
jgi:phospholipid N-methyltransferase